MYIAGPGELVDDILKVPGAVVEHAPRSRVAIQQQQRLATREEFGAGEAVLGQASSYGVVLLDHGEVADVVEIPGFRVPGGRELAVHEAPNEVQGRCGP